MKRIKDLKYIGLIENKLRNIYIKNTTVSIYLILVILYKKLVTFDIDQRAAAVSYSFMLAVFPAIIFIFTLIPYVPIEQLDVKIMGFLQAVIPAGIYETVAATIHDIVSRKRVDILSFGFIFAAFAATNGMMSLMRAFNMALQRAEKRNFFKARGIAFMLTFMLTFILVVAILVLIVGQLVFDFLFSKGIIFSENFNYFLIKISGYISVFGIFFIGICCIYYFAPAINRRLKFFNFGAVLASFLCILVTNVFSFYLANFSSYNKLYGSIGTLIGLMVWVYLIALILILGFEVNISLRIAFSNARKPKNAVAN
ncbi:YihY family inner membrane protein [Emticicia sp. CRIBPO]|uniref:YihY/virulence factor BrkB family protein n=1 Tax=Emticicia sp. CRIBPO TaxID=2683258 RepID=UPI0014136AF4|nr:YihY/virulence factor BrkB family protein [Emticicia sp. CRIBPO]NBA89217.1 YihY family inner membrane protein [Emticicia sp. CRIBPO]